MAIELINVLNRCVFLFRSLCGNFKQPLYYVACSSNIPMDALQRGINNCLNLCQKLGLVVRAIGCDQGPTNRKYFNISKISIDNNFFLHNNNKMYATYDIPHLFKSIRNNSISQVRLQTSHGVVSWEIIHF